jgi:hypothetical protein
MLVDQLGEVEFGFVREKKQNARDQKFVVTVVVLQSIYGFPDTPQFNKDLPRLLVQEKSVRQAPECFL